MRAGPRTDRANTRLAGGTDRTTFRGFSRYARISDTPHGAGDAARETCAVSRRFFARAIDTHGKGECADGKRWKDKAKHGLFPHPQDSPQENSPGCAEELADENRTR